MTAQAVIPTGTNGDNTRFACAREERQDEMRHSGTRTPSAGSLLGIFFNTVFRHRLICQDDSATQSGARRKKTTKTTGDRDVRRERLRGSAENGSKASALRCPMVAALPKEGNRSRRLGELNHMAPKTLRERGCLKTASLLNPCESDTFHFTTG